MARRAFIIGGTGQIGHAVAQRLLEDGWEVTLAARNPPKDDLPAVRQGARFVPLDRKQPGALAKALAGGTDALIDIIAFTAEDGAQLTEIQSDVGAFVVISTASVYRDNDGRNLEDSAKTGFPDYGGAIRETQALVEPGPQNYSTNKVALERALLDKSKRPVIILRPAAIHGPYAVDPREWWYVKRMLDRRPVIPIANEGRSRFHTTATVNIAALTATALRQPKTGIYNIGDPEAPTVREIGAAIGRHLNYAGEFLPLDDEQTARTGIGTTPWTLPGPLVLDNSAALAIGYKPVGSYAETVGLSVRWLAEQDRVDWKKTFPRLAAYPFDLFDYAKEDQALATLRKSS